MSVLLWLLLVAQTPFNWSVGPEPSRSAPRRPSSETAASRALGDRVYLQRCAACHGRRGDGRGWAANGLVAAPRDFTSGVYKLRSTPSGSIPTDDDLYVTIARGMHGTAMMPWRGLPEDERWALVQRLKRFSVRFSQEEPMASIVVPSEPPSDAALLTDGARLWERLRCGACHGRGDGRGPAVALLEKDPGRRVRVRDLEAGQFLRGTSARDIYLTIQTGMDGTPMGSYADALSPRETWALADFVRSLLRDPVTR